MWYSSHTFMEDDPTEVPQAVDAKDVTSVECVNNDGVVNLPQLPTTHPVYATLADRFKGARGGPRKGTLEIRAWSRSLLESSWYRQSLRKRLKEGSCPQIENTLYHYAYGKPKEVVELQASENLAGLLTMALGGTILAATLTRQQLISSAPAPVLDVLPVTPEGTETKRKVSFPPDWQRRKPRDPQD